MGGVVGPLPEFEYDHQKSEANKIKHGLDFDEGQAIWRDPGAIQIGSTFAQEQRVLRVGEICGKLWTVVFTMRDDVVRIISVRRARSREERLYEQKNDQR